MWAKIKVVIAHMLEAANLWLHQFFMWRGNYLSDFFKMAVL